MDEEKKWELGVKIVGFELPEEMEMSVVRAINIVLKEPEVKDYLNNIDAAEERKVTKTLLKMACQYRNEKEGRLCEEKSEAEEMDLEEMSLDLKAAAEILSDALKKRMKEEEQKNG